ncbi:ferrous iron transporter B, variant [Batrachochytrium dendrobatidis JEL423]|uniref:Ferrous iron transporter B, variant n=1 Tax=Batrachochytrium dendrobatidis (strain JEL423) TaxID=403673 RepID=A0A177WRI9_BATDL|nr:ferrous iron transporter B, variant [Batrachochytrium dendrobatidis JEL423]
MGHDVLIACVGKPSAGKSSFLNAISDATAKVGNFPFTTIKPNQGMAYVLIDCPCSRFDKQSLCKPRYGKCVQGKRHVPIKILDVAGLVPGASQGNGLGNQFLDDLRTADALIHVVDVSGTTDESGKSNCWNIILSTTLIGSSQRLATGYILICGKNGEILFVDTWQPRSSTAETLQLQFSGYGANLAMVNRFLDKFPDKRSLDMWNSDTVMMMVNAFIAERFPTLVALNKIDLPDSDKNIDLISRKYGQDNIVLVSALAETFLRKLHKQKFIKYHEGTDVFELAEDQVDPSVEEKLLTLDDKARNRLERVQDLVLFRYGHTGVQECLQQMIALLKLVPVFPVRNINSFSSSRYAAQLVFM